VFVELHIIQNFAPSNLNRDDTGSPKSAEFGGYRRARISSQCIKRAIRAEFTKQQLLPEERLAQRTKRVVEEVADRLGKPPEEAYPVIETLLSGVRLRLDEKTKGDGDWKTQYLLFLGEAEIAALTELCGAHWDRLLALVSPPVQTTEGQSQRRASARAVKSQAAQAVPRELSDALMGKLDGGRAADLALFGRMLADLPERNIDAASQVAHAISTHQVSTEFDFYTAVDDLRPEDTAGADMLGTVEFNSACYYRYSNVDMGQLGEKNLKGDRELALKTVGAFLRASVDAVPTGKQNSFAARNYPSLVFAVARESAPCSLANAFVRPVRPTRERDMVEESVRCLDSHWGAVAGMYGERGIRGKWVAYCGEEPLRNLQDSRVPDIDALVQGVLSSVSNGANPS
jgi:CRISPR system Cascade subunit CasC